MLRTQNALRSDLKINNRYLDMYRGGNLLFCIRMLIVVVLVPLAGPSSTTSSGLRISQVESTFA